MKFYGQEKIRKEFEALALRYKSGENFNLLIIGASGQGKSTLAFLLLANLDNFDETIYVIPEDDTNFSELFEKKRMIFIDEIHNIKKPEWLYPFLDKGDRSFLFATNESGSVKEPLYNRCTPIILESYSTNDLLHMADQELQFKFTDDLLERIVEVAKRNPRKINNLCNRLNYTIKEFPENLLDLEKVLNSLGYINGLDPMERQYITALKFLGGCASLTAICGVLRLTKETITRDIEPYLYNQIKITSKGRILI